MTGRWSRLVASCVAEEGSRGLQRQLLCRDIVFRGAGSVLVVLGGNGWRLTVDCGRRRRRGGSIACTNRKNGNRFKMGAHALYDVSAVRHSMSCMGAQQ